MGQPVEWQRDAEGFGAMLTTYKDTHDSLRTTFSDPPCIGTRYETYFDACELNDLDLFNGDLQTIEQLPEENLAGLSFQAPLSLSSSSSNSSSITPPQSAAHNSTVAPLPAMPGFPPGHWAPFREYPEPHYQQSLILSDPQSLMPSNLQSHIPSNHYGLGIGLPTHVPGLFGSAVDVVTDDDHKLDSFEKIYENEGADKAFHGAAFSFTPCTTGGTDGDDEAANEDANAYNKVLERCLRTRKDFTMSLKDIYAWVRDNSSKASPDPESKGWQNSVRHNLSMNGGFEKAPSYPGEGAKKGGAGLWRLTEDAILYGVKSTTKFRKPAENKGDRKNRHPAPKRQASGRKGGQATRNASLRYRKQQARARQATSAPNRHLGYQQYNLDGSPYSYASSVSSPAFNAMSAPNTPFAHLHPQDMAHGREIPFTSTTSQAQPLAQSFSAGYGPVQSAVEQYPLRHIDLTNAGPFRNYDTASSPYLTTPDMTDDSSPGFYMTPFSREESAQA